MRFKIIQKIVYRIIILNIFGLNFLAFEPTFTKENFAAPTEDYLRQYENSEEYIIGPGDNLFIKVSEDIDEIDMNIIIDGEGFAFLKRLKRVYIAGLTLTELTNILNKEYKKYVYEPEVEITITRYRPIKVLLKGEVKNPGLYVLAGSTNPFSNNNKLKKEATGSLDTEISNSIDSNTNPDMSASASLGFLEVPPSFDNTFFPSLVDVLREGGGLKTQADLSNITVIRNNTISNGGGKIETKFSLITIDEDDLNFANDIRVFSGDQIIVGKSDKPLLEQLSLAIRSNINPKFLNVYVGGKVEQPGQITINRGTTLNDALKVGGGKKILSGKVVLTRYDSDGNLERNSIRYKRLAKPGSFNNPYLENGDIIFVGKSSLNYATDILDEITKPFGSIVSGYGIYKIFND